VRPHLRPATPADGPQLLRLWELLFEDAADTGGWRGHALTWFAAAAGDPATAHVPVVAVGDAVVATAVGTLELGVPNPHCPRGRAVRLANVVTLPEHRHRGHATLLVADVVAWARGIGADRVDLSATPDGRRVYERAGFVLTSAPRMKLEL
jgi:GNAT superfamily N-acetyltransferase